MSEASGTPKYAIYTLIEKRIVSMALLKSFLLLSVLFLSGCYALYWSYGYYPSSYDNAYDDAFFREEYNHRLEMNELNRIRNQTAPPPRSLMDGGLLRGE